MRKNSQTVAGDNVWIEAKNLRRKKKKKKTIILWLVPLALYLKNKLK